MRPEEQELDPTHERGVDITHEEFRKAGGNATGWIRPCLPTTHYGTPCGCQEGGCEQ